MNAASPTAWKEARVLITGATGFIGANLTEHLHRQGCQHLFTLSRRPFLSPGVTHVTADLCDSQELKKQVGHMQFDYVFHCAGVIDQGVSPGIYPRQMAAHFNSTLNLLDCLPWPTARFVHFGSNAEYGSASCPQSPDGPTTPNSAYGVSKLAATHLVLAKAAVEGLRATVIRPFLVYGHGQSARSFLAQALLAARAQAEFPTSPGGQTRDFVDVRKVVQDALIAANDAAVAGRVINSCSGVERTVRSVLEILRELYPRFSPRFGEVNYRPAELMRSVGKPYQQQAAAEATEALVSFLKSP